MEAGAHAKRFPPFRQLQTAGCLELARPCAHDKLPAYPGASLLTERSIINFLVWIAGIIVGPYLAYSLLRQNELPLLVTAGLAMLFFMFAIAKDMLCIAPLVGLCFIGTLKIIPGKPSGYEFGAAAAIFYYLITYSALRRKNVLTGPLYLFISIAFFAVLIFLHDPHASLGLSGGGNEGGRGEVDVLLAAIAYICTVSMNSPSVRWFSLTPLFCIIATAISGSPEIISTYFPKTSEFLYIFTDNVNIAAYVVNVVGGTTDFIRNSDQAGLGASIALFLLCYFPIHTWWRPDRWWVAAIVAICSWLVIIGGFRSEFVSFVFMVGLAIWCHSSWRTLVLAPPLLSVLVVAVILQNSHIVHLPESAQRTLSFIPGDWDPDVIASTESSNDFREKIRTVYLKEEAAKHPWLGNGVTYNISDFNRYTYLAQKQEASDGYYGTKEFISAKMFHIGWISAYDAGGLIGCGFLSLLAFGLLWGAGKMVFAQSADRGSPLFPFKIWLFTSIATSIFGYLTVFGAVTSFFPQLCVYAAIWAHLNRLEKFGYRPPVANRMVLFDAERANLPVSA